MAKTFYLPIVFALKRAEKNYAPMRARYSLVIETSKGAYSGVG